MPKKRIRIITKKQKVTESKISQTTSLEQTVREPTFFPGRSRRTTLTLPFGTPLTEQPIPTNQQTERSTTPEPEATSREAFSYDRPGGTSTGNGTTYRIPGATDQSDAQAYRIGGQDNTIEADRRDRFKPLAGEGDRLRDTNELSKDKQDRYQGAAQTYQSSSTEKKNPKELERSRF